MEDKEYKTGGEPAPGAKRAKLEQQLRRLEVEAYCALISAFRAQGDLTWKKAQLLQDLRQLLRVSEERHKMELKRVTDDENLVEIAKLSSSLQFGESELDTALGDDAKSRAGRKKGGKAAWGDNNKEKALPYLDAVTAPISSQPPNLSKIPPAAKDAGAKGKAKARPVTPAKPVAAKPATPAAAANRKRKTPTPTPKKPAAGPPAKKRGPKSKTEVKPEDAAEVTLEEPEKVELEGEEDEEAHIKEVEEQLRAKQEQLRAELAALQAEMEDEEDLDEEEAINEEGDEAGGAEMESEMAEEGVEAME